MLTAGGVSNGEINYTIPGTLAQMGPEELSACRLASGGYMTVRSYTPSGAAKNDLIVLKSGSSGAISSHIVFGRTADDEIASGVAESGKWTLVPVNINDINGNSYLALIDTAAFAFVQEISLPGIKRVDSIIPGPASGEFIIVCTSNFIDMQIVKITIN
jgi:hypothetical protein